MAIHIYVVCRSSAPITYGQLEDYMNHWGWLDTPARFDPPLDDDNRNDANWSSFQVHYQVDRRPITVRRRVDSDDMAPALEDLHDMLEDADDGPARDDVSARLADVKQLIDFDIPDDLPEDVWEMLDATQAHLTRELDGVIVSEEGVFDGEMKQLVKFCE